MRVSARRVPSIAVALAALLALAGPPRPAAATSQETYVPLDAFGLDAGGEPRVSVFVSGQLQIASFLAFAPSFTGGVRVAVGDIDGDGIDDVVAGAGPGGGPHVLVFRGICTGTFTPPTGCSTDTFTVNPTPVASFFAFDPSFTGGVYVAVGNFDPSNDPTPGPPTCKRHEIVVAAGEGGGPHVRIFRNATTGGAGCPGGPVAIDAASPIASAFVFPPGFTGGVRVAAGDLNNDGFADLVVGAGPGGGPHVQAFPNLSTPGTFGGLGFGAPVASFFAFGPSFTGGVYVGLVGEKERRHLVVGAGAGGGPHVVGFENTGIGTAFGFNLAAPAASFFAFDAGFTGGVRVATHGGAPDFLLMTTGPGGAGFAKTVSFHEGPVPVNVGYSYVPFDLSPLGVFPSQ